MGLDIEHFSYCIKRVRQIWAVRNVCKSVALNGPDPGGSWVGPNWNQRKAVWKFKLPLQYLPTVKCIEIHKSSLSAVLHFFSTHNSLSLFTSFFKKKFCSWKSSNGYSTSESARYIPKRLLQYPCQTLNKVHLIDGEGNRKSSPLSPPRDKWNKPYLLCFSS